MIFFLIKLIQFQKFNQISEFQPNFRNLNQILEFQTNFRNSTKIQNYDQISDFIQI